MQEAADLISLPSPLSEKSIKKPHYYLQIYIYLVKEQMSKYVIIQRRDQSVDSTVRAVRGGVGICFDAACVWAGLLLS